MPERGSCLSTPTSGPIHKQAVPGGKERWVLSTSGESEASKLFCSEVSLQDGGVNDDQGSVATEGLNVHPGFERCVPVSVSFPRRQEVSGFYMGWQNVRVHLPPVWTMQCSLHFYKTPPPSYGTLAETRDTIHYIPGRHTIHAPVQRGFVPSGRAGSPVTGIPGLHHQQEKIPTDPVSEDPILGNPGELPRDEVLSSRGKIRDITQRCWDALSQNQLSVQHLSQLLGKFQAASLAVLSAPIRYRQLQQVKIQSFRRSRSFDTLVTLDQMAREELQWWRDQLVTCNGKDIVPPVPNMVIETDASTVGWGAVCQGIRTGGPWSQRERCQHINVLELRAAMLAVQMFAKGSTRRPLHIHLRRMDNVSALTYVSRMGGTHSPTLMKVACAFWDWCLQRGITLSASHLPGVNNWIADQESREIQTLAEWKLHKEIFLKVFNTMGPCNVDLFACCLNHQLAEYISWRPDPGAMGTDAFQWSWKDLKGYAFPPFALIGRCLQKVRVERSTVILIAPTWQNQPWYATLLEMLIEFPSSSSMSQGLVERPGGPTTPTNKPKQIKTSRLEDIWRQHTAAGVSAQTSELLLTGWSIGTNTAYESGWKQV